MADITKDQVIHNIKEKYLLATEDAETINYGNIDDKVYDAITSGGGGAYDGVAVIPIQSIDVTASITIS